MKAAGYDVTSEYYINDACNQITNLALSLYADIYRLLDKMPHFQKMGIMTRYYSNCRKFERRIGDKFLNIPKEEAIAYFRKIGTEHELQKIKDILKEFRVQHDVWFSETSLYENNKIEPTIQKLKDQGYTYESEGALWFKSTEFGDDKDRVLIKVMEAIHI